MKYTTARQQCEGNPLLRFCDNNGHFYIVYSYIYANTCKKRTYFCVSMATMVVNVPQCTVVRTLFILFQYQAALSWLWRLVAGLAPRRPWFDPRTLYVGVICWTKWHRNAFLREHSNFPLSVSFHYCSILFR